MNIRKITYHIGIFLLMTAFIAFVLYLNGLLAKKDREFKDSEAHCVIVRKEPGLNDWIYIYYCNDGHQFHEGLIYSVDGEDIDSHIQVGDSISKKAGDPIFKVFRKDENGKYVLYGVFKLMV